MLKSAIQLASLPHANISLIHGTRSKCEAFSIAGKDNYFNGLAVMAKYW
jgi:hypothetical protein